MPSVSPSTQLIIPHPHESSRLRSPRDADNTQRQWKRNAVGFDQISAMRSTIDAAIRNMEKTRRRILGGAAIQGGMTIASPMEYDMTKSYPALQWVYVSAGNDAVTMGGTDADSGLPTNSTAGWYCSGNVPVPGPNATPAYHLPQSPLPDDGDIDSKLNWWVIYVGQSGVASNLNWRGYYNPTSTYGLYDMVYFGAGTASGTYISIIPSNTNAPDTGIGWVQSGGGNAWL